MNSFEGQAALIYEFPDQIIELKVQDITIATFTLGTKVTGKLFISLNKETFLLQVSATLQLPGLPELNVNLTLNEFNLEEIPDAILKSIMSQVEDNYKATLADPLALAKLLDLDGLKPAKIAAKLKELKHSAYDIAKALNKISIKAIDVTKALKEAFPNLLDVTRALDALWSVTPKEMAKVLNLSGYSIPDVAKGTKYAVLNKLGPPMPGDVGRNDLVVEDVGNALKTQFPKMEDNEEGLDSLYRIIPEKMAEVFNKIGFSREEIASYAKDKWKWPANKVADVFGNRLNLKQDEIIQAMTQASFPQPELEQIKMNWPKPGGSVGRAIEEILN